MADVSNLMNVRWVSDSQGDATREIQSEGFSVGAAREVSASAESIRTYLGRALASLMSSGSLPLGPLPSSSN